MNTGSVPTERHARTGELTPPGMTARARSKIDWLRWIGIAAERTADRAGGGAGIVLVRGARMPRQRAIAAAMPRSRVPRGGFPSMTLVDEAPVFRPNPQMLDVESLRVAPRSDRR
jgi:hypothetical protein